MTKNDPMGELDAGFFQGSRAERIARHLSSRILRKEFQVGSKLPTENAMASHFGVSRAVIREAIAMLKAEGLVETLQGSGAFITSTGPLTAKAPDKLTRASLHSLMDLLEVRGSIESAIAERAARVRTEHDILRIDAALERLRQAEEAGRPGVAEDVAFHASIAEASGNRYWMTLVQSLEQSIQIAISVTRVNEAQREDFTSQASSEHQAIRDAIVAGDPERARRSAALHMEEAAARIMSADQNFWKTGGSPVTNLPTT